jgi:hypothetical protein
MFYFNVHIWVLDLSPKYAFRILGTTASYYNTELQRNLQSVV